MPGDNLMMRPGEELIVEDEKERDDLKSEFEEQLMRFEAIGSTAPTGSGGHTHWEGGFARQRVGSYGGGGCGCGGHEGHEERLADNGYDSKYGSSLRGGGGCGGGGCGDWHGDDRGTTWGNCTYKQHDVTAIGPGGHTYSSCSSYPAGGSMCYVTKKVCDPDCSCRLVVTHAYFRRDCTPCMLPSAGGMNEKLLGDASYQYVSRDYEDEGNFRLTPAPSSAYDFGAIGGGISGSSGKRSLSSSDYETWRSQALSSNAARELLPTTSTTSGETKA